MATKYGKNVWKESSNVPICKKADSTALIIKEYHCYQLRTEFYLTFFSQG
jgi:hypothetical protein